MSDTAPWFALAVDFDESEMWDALPGYGIPDESTMGERLAWVCLIAEAKKKGRGGKVIIRKSVFQKAHRLTGRAVDGMLARAQKCGAIQIDGNSVTLCNWSSYQDKKGGRKGGRKPDSPGSAVPITHHPSPITTTTPTPTKAQPRGNAEQIPVTWSSLSSDFSDAGIELAEELCRTAKAAGNLPHEVARELAKGLDLALPPGVIYNRLSKMVPDRRVNWPAPPEAVQREQAVEAGRKRTEDTMAKLARDRSEAAKQKTLETNQARTYENTCGPELDALSKTELRKLVEENFPALVHLIPKRGKVEPGLLRQQLLWHIAARQEAAT